MSAYAPNAQSGPVQRHQENWQSAQPRFPSDESYANGNGEAISEKISGFFGADRKDALPMYKDKPYAYPGGRTKPWFKQAKPVAAILTTLAVLSWLFGIFSPSSSASTVRLTDGKTDPATWMPNIGGQLTATTWEERASKVKAVFKKSFAGYEKYAWGYDEFHPVSKQGRHMTPSGMGWIIVDALDTMMLMNLTTEVEHARQWIHHNLTYDQDHDVNTFETTIRMLGGLLSAHYLSTDFPGTYAAVNDDLSEDLYLEKAADLADRLLGAYETQSGVPLASVNLHSMKGIASHADAGASSTAEATSLQLEMKYLAKLTGEDHFWDKAEHVMKVIDDNNPKDGLVPIFMHADRGTFQGDNIRLGSRGDSYYEYLIKQYLQTSTQEPVYQAMWNESLEGIKKHLITYSYPHNFTVLAERPSGLDRSISPKMDHLVCFLPGTIALATTGGVPLDEAKKQPNWGPKQDEDMRLAEDLMKTCWGMYRASPLGLAGEITHFNIYDPPLMYNDFPQDDKPSCPHNFDYTGLGPDFSAKDDFIIKSGDAHNLQRPETVESLFYMYRITGDDKYRYWAWTMFESFQHWTAVEDGTGYSSLASVLQKPPKLRDNMESFWLAETLKYLYLLFAPSDILPLTDVVFNTEAHAFPRFQLNKLLSTGWQRKPRDKDGNILPGPETKQEPAAVTIQTPARTQEKKEEVTPKVAALEDHQAALVPPEEEAKLDPVTGKEKVEG